MNHNNYVCRASYHPYVQFHVQFHCKSVAPHRGRQQVPQTTTKPGLRLVHLRAILTPRVLLFSKHAMQFNSKKLSRYDAGPGGLRDQEDSRFDRGDCPTNVSPQSSSILPSPISLRISHL